MDRHFLSTEKTPDIPGLGSGFLRLRLCGILFPHGRKVEVRRGAVPGVVTGRRWGLGGHSRQTWDRGCAPTRVRAASGQDPA